MHGLHSGDRSFPSHISTREKRWRNSLDIGTIELVLRISRKKSIKNTVKINQLNRRRKLTQESPTISKIVTTMRPTENSMMSLSLTIYQSTKSKSLEVKRKILISSSTNKPLKHITMTHLILSNTFQLGLPIHWAQFSREFLNHLLELSEIKRVP